MLVLEKKTRQIKAVWNSTHLARRNDPSVVSLMRVLCRINVVSIQQSDGFLTVLSIQGEGPPPSHDTTGKEGGGGEVGGEGRGVVGLLEGEEGS